MAKKEPKPFIGIMFKCCKTYNRIYLNKQKTAFVGWCPKCAKQARVNISAEGSNETFFEIS